MESESCLLHLSQTEQSLEDALELTFAANSGPVAEVFQSSLGLITVMMSIKEKRVNKKEKKGDLQ